jgi:uncharacterized membrane protein YfcA
MVFSVYASIVSLMAKQPAWNSWTKWYWWVVIGYIVLGVILGSWTGAVAARKGMNSKPWFWIGFLIPVVGLVACYMAKPKAEPVPKE